MDNLSFFLNVLCFLKPLQCLGISSFLHFASAKKELRKWNFQSFSKLGCKNVTHTALTRHTPVKYLFRNEQLIKKTFWRILYSSFGGWERRFWLFEEQWLWGVSWLEKKKSVVGVPGIAKSSVVLDQAPQWVWGLLKKKKESEKDLYIRVLIIMPFIKVRKRLKYSRIWDYFNKIWFSDVRRKDH